VKDPAHPPVLGLVVSVPLFFCGLVVGDLSFVLVLVCGGQALFWVRGFVSSVPDAPATPFFCLFF